MSGCPMPTSRRKSFVSTFRNLCRILCSCTNRLAVTLISEITSYQTKKSKKRASLDWGIFLFWYALGTIIGRTLADYIGRRISLAHHGHFASSRSSGWPLRYITEPSCETCESPRIDVPGLLPSMRTHRTVMPAIAYRSAGMNGGIANSLLSQRFSGLKNIRKSSRPCNT